jgi:hypothetical protein
MGVCAVLPAVPLASPRVGALPDAETMIIKLGGGSTRPDTLRHIDHAGWLVGCPLALLVDPPLPKWVPQC